MVTTFLLQLSRTHTYIYASFFFCIMNLHLILFPLQRPEESYALDFYFSVNLLYFEVHQQLFFWVDVAVFF